MTKFFWAISILVLFGSCSNLSKNFSKKGEFVLRGGTFQNSQWNKTLEFDRYSWFHEVTMVYDLIVARVDPRSPFYDWFSTAEKGTLANCSDSYLVVDYALDADRISKKMVENDAKRAGYEKIALNSFKSHLSLHPDVEALSLQLYDVYGFCYKGELSSREKVIVRFPGFKEVPVD